MCAELFPAQLRHPHNHELALKSADHILEASSPLQGLPW